MGKFKNEDNYLQGTRYSYTITIFIGYILDTYHHSIQEHLSDGNTLPDELFLSSKCSHFSQGGKDQVKRAYFLSQEAHVNDRRKTGYPYMDHIDGVTRGYVGITNKEFLSPDDLCVAILHDVIEDHPHFSERIEREFGSMIYHRVLRVSKPNSHIIRATFGILSMSWIESTSYKGSLDDYLPGKLAQQGPTKGKYYPMHSKLLQLWRQNSFITNEKQLGNYMFLWQVADLSEDDFEIKCADRINNLDHLGAVDMKYVIKNIESTGFYILKARAHGREDLVMMLENGISNLEKRKKELQATISI